MKEYDVIIIGGGICGMTAAIYASRANLSVCIIEKEICGGLVNSTNIVENVPSYIRIHGIDLMSKCREHIESLNVDIEEVNEVESFNFLNKIKVVKTSMEEVYRGKAIIIATGRIPRQFPINTDFNNIHYCSICDGPSYKGKSLIVLGGGNSGFDESLYLLSIGVKSIHIVETYPTCIADALTQKEALDTGKITVSTSTDIISVKTIDSKIGEVVLLDKNNNTYYTENVDGIFCFIGQRPNTDIFKEIIHMENGYIITDENMNTNIPGVFAAGDVTRKKYRQITTAMGDGTIAALEAIDYIRKNF